MERMAALINDAVASHCPDRAVGGRGGRPPPGRTDMERGRHAFLPNLQALANVPCATSSKINRAAASC